MSEEHEKSLRNRTVFNGKLTVAELIMAVAIVFGAGVNYSIYNNALAEGEKERDSIATKHTEDIKRIEKSVAEIKQDTKDFKKEIKENINQINQNIFEILQAVK